MKTLFFIVAITFVSASTPVQSGNYSSHADYMYSNLNNTEPLVNLLCTLIAKGDTETVKKLIEFGEDVNEKSNGLTPAMYASKYNRTEILKYLILRGAKLTVKCDKGYTALEYSIATNAKEAQMILEANLKK
ncbi:ankyrin repeat domain-containing protein [Formosa agariphila]|nr:ankyrin repeat domain-containing protein [Formosa agariphila]